MRRVCALLLLGLAIIAPARASEPPVILFAAASTTDAVTEVVGMFEALGHGRVKTVFGSSATLARQIAHGAPADLFLSANSEWIDYLDARGLLVPKTRRTLLGNRLVLAVPADSPLGPGLTNPLPRLLSLGRLALADPASVPAGRYAQEALTSTGQWAAVSRQAVYTANVRAALKWIARGEVAGGIIYATDAAIEPTVRPIWEFPPTTHSAITYTIVQITEGRSDTAARLREFLSTHDVTAIFSRYGFLPPRAAGGSARK